MPLARNAREFVLSGATRSDWEFRSATCGGDRGASIEAVGFAQGLSIAHVQGLSETGYHRPNLVSG